MLEWATLAIGFFVVAFVGAANACDPPSLEKRLPVYHDRAVIVAHDNQFLLLRCGDEVVAFLMTVNPRYGCDGIVYRWFRTKDSRRKFFARSSESPGIDATVDIPHNKDVDSGFGEMAETETTDPLVFDIVIGHIAISWSSRDAKTGYLYIGYADTSSRTQPPIEIYHKRFLSLADTSEKLLSSGWKTLPKEEEKPTSKPKRSAAGERKPEE